MTRTASSAHALAWLDTGRSHFPPRGGSDVAGLARTRSGLCVGGLTAAHSPRPGADALSTAPPSRSGSRPLPHIYLASDETQSGQWRPAGRASDSLYLQLVLVAASFHLRPSCFHL